MRRWLLLVAVACLAGADAGPPPPDGKAPPAVGANVPGPFLPYNVTGPHKGRFHCLVTDYGLEPVVMLVARDLDKSEDLKRLVTGLDAAIARNPSARLHAFVVFLADDKKDLVKDDDWRAEVVGDYEKWAESLKPPPRHVVLTLAGKADLEKYALKDESALTAVLYRRYKIVASHSASKDEVKGAANAILDEVKTKLGVGK